MTPVVIAAFIAAVVGSFLGAYFKEFLFDKFNKGRRQMDIRTKFVKELPVYYGALQSAVQIENALELEKTRSNAYLKSGAAIPATVHRHDEFIRELELGHDKIVVKINELEGEIQALSVEASHCFKSHLNKQLKKLITNLIKDQDNSLVMDYSAIADLDDESIDTKTPVTDRILELAKIKAQRIQEVTEILA